MSAIIATSAEIFTIVRLAGVAWLLWLAWKAFRSRAEGTLANMTVEQQDRRGVWAAFRNGLVVGALNPKTAVFFLTPTPPSPRLRLRTLDRAAGVVYCALATYALAATARSA
ncbi:LysE family translocator [Phytohabitans flavus]|uniref:Lysine transporter LysE n=1 Tax=Phytohabitans flavus TaxID=1076124 RepID=A0A6F8XMD8_9ACTN|nr:LysE family transporter [Phytohabitans flavus]BCB74976.1 hypothetical protein Pflav_013860 [Phytohabitans flavus]